MQQQTLQNMDEENNTFALIEDPQNYKDMTCQICKGIFENPVDTLCCSRTFCQNCVSSFQQCPVCQTVWNNNQPNLRPSSQLVKNLVNAIPLLCKACQMTIRRDQREQHLMQCARPCRNNCGSSYTLPTKMNHLQVCPLEVVPCNAEKIGCRVRLRKVDMRRHEEEECVLMQLTPVLDRMNYIIQEQQKQIDMLMGGMNEMRMQLQNQNQMSQQMQNQQMPPLQNSMPMQMQPPLQNSMPMQMQPPLQNSMPMPMPTMQMPIVPTLNNGVLPSMDNGRSISLAWTLPTQKNHYIKLDEFSCGPDKWYVIIDESKKDSKQISIYLHLKNRRDGVTCSCDCSIGDVTKSFTYTFGQTWNRGWATFMPKSHYNNIHPKELRLKMDYL